MRRRATSGQSTVEFAVVATVFLAVSLGLWALATHISEGGPVDTAVENAAYGLGATGNAARYLLMF